ncbi:hypothetical protein [Proteiniphilum sp.]|uniref:hypothetical protein n=1 Tax=Proteiniphilum sp. TaxID=1926877 RepID=UPI00333350CD
MKSLIFRDIGKIIIEVDDITIERWNAMSRERKEKCIRQIEELIEQPSLDKMTVNESESTYGIVEKKEKKMFEKLQRDKGFISPKDRTYSKKEYRRRIEALTAPLLLDFSKFQFDRNQANNYEES